MTKLVELDPKSLNQNATDQKMVEIVVGLPTIEEQDEYSDPESDCDDSEEYDPLEELLDIDIRNLTNPMKLAKYAELIFCKARDEFTSLVPSADALMRNQVELTAQMHETAVKWMFKIHREYNMARDTLFQAVAYLNGVIANRTIRVQELQLVTVTCLWLASKIEEGSIPKLDDMCAICSDHFTPEDFVRCEKEILISLGFRLNYPTSIFFLRRLLDVIDADDDIREVSKFFCELSLVPIVFLNYRPDLIALSSICLGKVCLGEYCPTRRMSLYGHIDDIDEMKKCCVEMLGFARGIIGDETHFLFQRYTRDKLTGAIRRISISDDLISQI